MRELDHFPPQPHRPEYVRRLYDAFRAHLAKNGLRLTEQRRLILDYFLGAERHVSQDEIYTALRPRGLGRATVFRTLKMLEQAGLVNHLSGSGGIPRFELNLERPHHDHLICVDCGRIQEVSWPKLERIQERSCREAGFTPKWHRHEVFGLCRDCGRRRASPSASSKPI
ncbi:MAG: transcriptional repressor [Elusimicrobia bacterium]|nr:transcriptional repressor [Elusimicrobiota bacterium]